MENTTSATLTGITLGEPEINGLTMAECRIIRQIRSLSAQHSDNGRPFMLSMRVTSNGVEFYAGHPAGKVDE